MGWLSDKIDRLAEDRDVEGLRDLRERIVNGEVTDDDDEPAVLKLERKLTR